MYRRKPLKDVVEPHKSRSPQGNNGVHAHNMARRCFSNDDIESALRNRAQSPQGTAARSSSASPVKRSVAFAGGISASNAGSTGTRGMRLCEIHSARVGAKIARPVVRSGNPSKVSTPSSRQVSKQNGQLSKKSPALAKQDGERIMDVAGSSEPIQANGKVSTPSSRQVSKQNGQPSKSPDAEFCAPNASAGKIQSESGGNSSPPLESSTSAEGRVTLDINYLEQLLRAEPFGNPYKLAAALADNIRECSRVDISAGTVYSLFCNSLLSELMGDSYIPGVLRQRVTRMVCKFARSVDFQRGRVVVDEVRSVRLINVNRYAAGAASVDSYTYGIYVASRMQLNTQVFQDLLSTRYTPVSPEGVAYKNVANTVLRFVFSYLVHLESLRHATPQEEEADATVLSILEYLDDEHTNIHNMLRAEDYQGFYQYMKHLVASDACRANALLLSAGQKASAYMSEHYNALLSNIIAYQCVKTGCPSGPTTRDMLEKIGRNAMQHLMPLLCFSTVLSGVVARIYNATNKEDLIHAMMADNAHLIMESRNFKSTLVGAVAPALRKVMPPLEVHTRYNQENLEKIAAAVFIFYPGCNFDGSDIVLDRDGLKLLNVGEGKIRTSHNFFDEREVSHIVQHPDILLSELQLLFWGFRLSAGQLKWKEFLLELNELCETMITSQFAEVAQSGILRELTGIKHLRRLDDRIGQVVYESFLPRVLCIRNFLRQQQLTEPAECLINFLPGPSATSGELSRLLLRICGIHTYNPTNSCFISEQETGTPEPLRVCEPALKAAIDEHAGDFLRRFQADDRESTVERTLEDEFSRGPGTQYRPSELSEQQRRAIVKTASWRSATQYTRYILATNIHLIALCFAIIVLATILIIYTPPHVFIPCVTVLSALLGFVMWQQHPSTDARVEHCMSIPPQSITTPCTNIYSQPSSSTGAEVSKTPEQSLSSMATQPALAHAHGGRLR